MNELKKKVEEAKQVLGLEKNWHLSEAMGRQGRYLDRVLSDGVSTKKQKEIVSQLNTLIELHNYDDAEDKKIVVDLSEKGDYSNNSMWVSKAYHDQEINILKNSLKYAEEAFSKKHQEIMDVEKLSDSRWDELQEQTQNVRMLNMEVEQFKVDCKELENDLAIANRDKDFMKRKLQDKNLLINWLIALNVFFVLFLVAKCAGWV